MDSFVQQKLINWNLECLIEKFADEQIDDDSFLLLDENTIATLIPKIGVRLKFLKHFKELKFNSIPPHSSIAPENTQPSTSPENTVSTFGCTSPENTQPTFVLQLVPDDTHDIRAVLMKAPHGPSIVESLESNTITTQQRRAMVRIIVAHLIEKYGETPSTETKKAMAISLVETFSCLRDPEGNGYEAWFSPGQRHRPSTGFLEERLRNIRKRMRRLRTPSSVAFICEKRSTVIPASILSPERAVQLKEWLKNNTRPQDQVEQYMKETALFRAHWIRENGSKPISEVLSEFPRLMDTPGMISQDFSILHPDAADKMCLSWLPVFADKILAFAKRDGRQMDVLNNLDNMSADSKGILALKILPVILPPPVYKIGHKTFRPTIQEARNSFIDVQPSGTNMVLYLERQREAKPFPFVLELGLAGQFFLVVNGQALEQVTLLKAVDVCFKSFYCFDLHYPKQCAPVWEFLQQVVYGMPGTENSSIRFLRASIFAAED
ncbi:uncharacterized protein LOC130082154 [Rhinichthys klamathensis goyatoka]|uniref:uncharacterized protein LOC130082154 n=1 Tax=Rhinichthys klamathensis goyatoka TaxID=3034132 RepID=UPI0024B626F4|nr:uncharacterized protein LOC130082154 [Rhinichthys klamathensis goyatoka]